MAISLTFLDFINETLKRARVIQGDSGELATSTVTSTSTGLIATDAFVDGSRQSQIDIALQVSNEVFTEAFSLGLFPREAASATITLASGTREYDLPTNFERMAGLTWSQRVFRGATTGLVIGEYAGGYAQMLADQPIATDYTGDPQYYAFNPGFTATTARVRLDREAATEQNGDVYNALYERSIRMSSTQATDTMPFTDVIADQLGPVAASMFNTVFKSDANSTDARAAMRRAIQHLTQTQPRHRYGLHW